MAVSNLRCIPDASLNKIHVKSNDPAVKNVTESLVIMYIWRCVCDTSLKNIRNTVTAKLFPENFNLINYPEMLDHIPDLNR